MNLYYLDYWTGNCLSASGDYLSTTQQGKQTTATTVTCTGTENVCYKVTTPNQNWTEMGCANYSSLVYDLSYDYYLNDSTCSDSDAKLALANYCSFNNCISSVFMCYFETKNKPGSSYSMNNFYTYMGSCSSVSTTDTPSFSDGHRYTMMDCAVTSKCGNYLSTDGLLLVNYCYHSTVNIVNEDSSCTMAMPNVQNCTTQGCNGSYTYAGGYYPTDEWAPSALAFLVCCLFCCCPCICCVVVIALVFMCCKRGSGVKNSSSEGRRRRKSSSDRKKKKKKSSSDRKKKKKSSSSDKKKKKKKSSS